MSRFETETTAITKQAVTEAQLAADRFLRLQQAAEFYLMQAVDIHTFVGIASFSSKGEIRAQLHQINSDDD
ncbi:hypothetical protein MC885_001144 [Smutsia gigantea]|nr:hypothetical protein MC885_001144 [Smutsia gigantea]